MSDAVFEPRPCRMAVWVSGMLLMATVAWPSENNASTPLGEVFKELPTLHCLAVRWKIKGDANRNAAIETQYRKVGDQEWKQGFSLMRTMPNPHRSNRSRTHTVAGGWLFAGSIVGLTPDTEYEVKLTLKDPDGGKGEQTVKMKTWKEPLAPKNMVVKHVVPGNGGGTGTKEDPFKGIEAAHAAAEPGTLFLLHKGTYIKGDCKGNTWTITRSGKPGKPIIYRAAGDGEVIMDGGGSPKTGGRGISACKTRHIWFEGLTIQGRSYVLVAHEGSHWVLRGCRFRNMTKGFTAHNGGYDVSQHHFIVDNVFEGTCSWPRKKGIEPFGGIKMSGAGHVVAYNTFHNLGDGIHGTNHGSLSATDYHNNDVYICTDDGFETDSSDSNVRVFHNRFVNVIHALTSQPSHGGPTLFFRNFIYNATYSPFKLHNHTTGVMIFHNTCIRKGECLKIVPSNETVTNLWTRNNLFIGQSKTAMKTWARFRSCDFNNDGWGGCGQPKHALLKGKTVHVIDPKTCFASGLAVPANPSTVYKGGELDYRLGEKSEAIDKGVVLPGLNDGFKGKAPDLGALEFGEEMPYFGPRKKK